MVRLVMCVPCERVIEGKDGTVSIIAMMFGATISAGVVPAQEAPEGVPMRWELFSLWAGEPTDEGASFEQAVEIIAPSGATSLRRAIPFKMEKLYHRVIARLEAFPVAEAGEHTLNVHLKRIPDGESKLFESFSFKVEHVPLDKVDLTA